ncbi:hypothetical protein WAI453_001690 [Rhynchosporium graminicola]
MEQLECSRLRCLRIAPSLYLKDTYDCWSSGRDEKDNLVVDTKKLPSGKNAVSNDVQHRQGMSFGMYSSPREMTSGLLDYETNDANSFAAWGAGYLKSDNCYHMGRFESHGMSIANSWGMSRDIFDSFSRICACTGLTGPHCIAPGSHCSSERAHFSL